MNSRTKVVIVTAILSAILTSMCWVVGIVVAYQYFMGDPPPFAVSIQAPGETAPGEVITLKARVSNPSDHRLQLGSIDVYDSLLDGFTVVGVDPEPVTQADNLDFKTFYFSKPLDPGETLEFTFRLEAKQAGIWTGDVDICTPAEKFVTSSVTIRVRGQGAAGARSSSGSP